MWVDTWASLHPSLQVIDRLGEGNAMAQNTIRTNKRRSCNRHARLVNAHLQIWKPMTSARSSSCFANVVCTRDEIFLKGHASKTNGTVRASA